MLPFGADGVVLKTAKASGAWQYVHVCKVQEAFGFGQQGFIALALLAGCDFTRGFDGVGAEKLCSASVDFSVSATNQA